MVTRWVQAHTPDVLCLQETKVQDTEFPVKALESTGYVITFRGMKGYNGVAVLTKTVPDFTSNGLEKGPDADGYRLLHIVIRGIAIVNTYIPQGFRIDHPQYQYKLQWLKRLHRYFSRHFSPDQPVIWCGDMNVAPAMMDVHHPEKHLTHVCFHQDAREAYHKIVNWGFEDVFRRLYPDRQQFTFWDYRQPNALKANRGWRIDHILATKPLAQTCTAVDVDVNPRRGKNPSDHTILWANFLES